MGGLARTAFGGTVLYAARTYAALGLACRVVTSAAVADHPAIRAAFPPAVELELLASPVTTTFENVYGEDQSRRQRATALGPPLRRPAAALESVDVLHLGPLYPDDLDADWFEISFAGRALDVQGLTRRIVGADVEPTADPHLLDWCGHCRWIKGSAREWALIGAAFGCLPALACDRERLVTRGIEGGEVEARSGRHAWRAAPPIEGCDPTGAGDVYFAAYLAARVGGAEPGSAATAAARYTSAFLAQR